MTYKPDKFYRINYTLFFVACQEVLIRDRANAFIHLLERYPWKWIENHVSVGQGSRKIAVVGSQMEDGFPNAFALIREREKTENARVP
jgi:hypothetical protein